MARLGRSLLGGLALIALLVPGPASAASPFAAFVKSLIVPGWSQYSNGQTGSAARFALAEALLLGGTFGMTAVSSIREDNYRTYATEHAGATPQGKKGVYFDDLGFYMSQQQHDLFALVDDGPEAELYGLTSGNTWEWDEDDSRKRYRKLRNSAQSAERNALFATGLVVVNHLVAAVHAARTARDPFAQAPRWTLEPLASRGLTQGVALIRRF